MSPIPEQLIDSFGVALITGDTSNRQHRHFPKSLVTRKPRTELWSLAEVLAWQHQYQRRRLKLGVAWAFLRGDASGGLSYPRGHK